MYQIKVSVVYATPQKQWLYETSIARGTSAQELIQLSGFMNNVEALEGQKIDQLNLGVYSQRIQADYLLVDGDRVEIYRMLTADPKDVRRKLALLGKTMSSK